MRYLSERVSSELTELGGGPMDADALLLRRVERLPALRSRSCECWPSSVVRRRALPLVREVAALGGEELQTLHRLRVQHFIRLRRGDGQEPLEPYHDRIRETVVAAIPAERQQAMHHALISALERADSHEYEALAWHRQQIGDVLRARAYFAESGATGRSRTGL